MAPPQAAAAVAWEQRTWETARLPHRARADAAQLLPRRVEFLLCQGRPMAALQAMMEADAASGPRLADTRALVEALGVRRFADARTVAACAALLEAVGLSAW